MVNDTEIQKMIDTINKRSRDMSIKAWDRQIYKFAGLKRKDHTLTVQEFKDIFKNKLEYGLKMLEEMSKDSYIASINQKYKDDIVTMLYRMGLEYDAKQVEEMGLTKFMEYNKQGKWEYIYDRYSSIRGDLDLVDQAPNQQSEDKIGRISKNISRHLPKLLGYETKSKKN